MLVREDRVSGRNMRLLICRRHEDLLAGDRSVDPILFPTELLMAVLADRRAPVLPRIEPDDIDRWIGWYASFRHWMEGIAPACEWLPSKTTERAWRRARALGHDRRG